MDKKTTSFKLSSEDRRILAELAESLGISKTGVLRLAIRVLRNKHQQETKQ